MSPTGLFARETRPLTFMVAGGVALYSANIYIASAVMPSVASDLGGLSLYAWATSLFVFAAVLGSTAAATVLGRIGVRNAYAAAMLVVGAGTAVCALAPTMPVLLVGRFAQGAGGGVVFALAYALVRLVMPQEVWARAMALISAMWGVGTFLGPAVGGTFAELGRWRLAFWLVVAVTLAFAAWAAVRLPEDAGRQARPACAPLRSVAVLGAAVLVLSTASASTRVWINLVGLAAAALLVVAWLRLERRSARRLLPSATFGSDRRLRWLYVTMALLMVAATPEVFVAYFGQQLNGLSPLAAGYLATALAAGWTSASLLTGGAERAGSLLVRGAPVVSLAGLILLTVVGPLQGTDAALFALLALGFVGLGAGIGIAWPRLVTEVLTVVPDDEGDLAGASVTTVQLSAATFGAAIGGAIVNLAGLTDPGGITGAHDAARWLYPVIAIAPVLALLALRRARSLARPKPVVAKPATIPAR